MTHALVTHVTVLLVLGMLLTALPTRAAEPDLTPGQVVEIAFGPDRAPPTLHALFGQTAEPATLAVRLPDDYDPSRTYPLLVYVPGLDGGRAGNIANAQAIAGPRGWVVASLPLFKKTLDRAEPAGGLIVSVEDYPVIADAYEAMLGELLKRVPNIDPARSTMVGFSNGALTVAVLVSAHDPFIIEHFRNFCLVDHGMFHLTDLHKRGTRDCRFLILVGDKPDLGRDVKIRGAQLLQDAYRLLGVNITAQVMQDTGHEFGPRQMQIVHDWLDAPATQPAPAAPVR